MASPARHHQLLLEQHRKLSLHYLSGHDLEWYARAICRPLFYLISLNFAFYLVGGLPNMAGTFNAVFLPLIFFVEIVVYAWLGWKIAWHTSWKTLPYVMKAFTCAFAGALTGIGLGIVLSLFKIFWYREFWTLFNVVTEGPLRLLEGFLVSGLVGLITLFFVRWQQNKGKYGTHP